jgi:hypothetical protein
MNATDSPKICEVLLQLGNALPGVTKGKRKGRWDDSISLPSSTWSQPKWLQ